ncbi:post-transcriptional regulator [Paenibacillus sp. sptzw28]|uniref:post-transcriptional regulator n=1 Tax=Paenibacillus sp. sptzw28 TaxID=715179 RepID=UPI0021635572|nr:post-transcriptional regulator [Paenibacillus sp. sptzw28]
MADEDTPMTTEEWNATIESLCDSKAAEFRLVGYEHVTGKEIWECVSDKYAKTGEPAMHQVVNDILSLKVTRFMNFMTLNAYRGTHF